MVKQYKRKTSLKGSKNAIEFSGANRGLVYSFVCLFGFFSDELSTQYHADCSDKLDGTCRKNV